MYFGIIINCHIMYYLMFQIHVDQIITLTIHGIGSNGEGVGYFQGFTVFVDGALPNEIVEARVYQRQKRYGKARIIKICKPSPDRV